jgi:RES domain-containing protein
MQARRRPSLRAWSGVAFRATSYDVPLWSRSNRRSGRWNIARQGCTQYACLDAEGAVAELLRYEDLRTEEEGALFSTGLWQLRVSDGAVVDYSTFDRAEAAGFPPEALVDDDHERCQTEASWLQSHGARGLLAPSAALPGSVCLTLFGPRVPVGWDTETQLASALPVQRLTTGQPPRGLVARVRFHGDPHPAYEQYVRLPGEGSDPTGGGGV